MKSHNASRKFRKLSTLSGICLAAMVVTSAGESFAQEPPPAAGGDEKSNVRYTRKSGKVRTKDTLDTKFKAQKEAQEKESKRKVDMMQGAEFAKKRSAVAQEIADTQIEQLKRLLKATDPSHADYPDLLFRLSDHFLEKKAYFENQVGALYEDIYAAEEAKNKTKADQLKAKQAKFEGQAKEASEQAVKIYKVLVSSPQLGKFKRLDEALYFYAFELGQLKREAEMKEAYIRLIQDFPNSQYIPNAYLAFADYYFGKSKIGDALQLYEKVVTFQDSPVYAYALYKMAWCHLNPIGAMDARFDRSLDYFVKTITATLEGRAGSEANAKQLRRDARRDLVQAFVQAGKPSKAWEFFQKIGNGPKQRREHVSQDDGAARRPLLRRGHVHRVDLHLREAAGALPRGPDDLRLAGPHRHQHARHRQQGGPVERDRAARRVLDQVQGRRLQAGHQAQVPRRDARHDEADGHRLARRGREDQARGHLRAGRAGLRRVLDHLPEGDKDAYEIQFFYAELLWARAGALVNDKKSKAEGLTKFRKAHDEFIKVLEINPEGKFTQDAAFAQMLAMKNALEYDETGGPGEGVQDQLRGHLRLPGKGEEEEGQARREDLDGHERRVPRERVHGGREGDARSLRHVPQVREGREGRRAAEDRVPPGQDHDGSTTSSRTPSVA